MMTQITFVTGNQGKWQIAKDVFQKYDIELLHEKIDTPEIQSLDVTEVATFSARYASQQLKKPVLKTDVGYYFNGLSGFPGPFIKHINQTLQSDDLLRLMHGVNDRSVTIRECLALAATDGSVFTCISEQVAHIAHTAEGEGSMIDQLLILEGFDRPKGVYNSDVILSHWKNTLSSYNEMARHILGLMP